MVNAGSRASCLQAAELAGRRARIHDARIRCDGRKILRPSLPDQGARREEIGGCRGNVLVRVSAFSSSSLSCGSLKYFPPFAANRGILWLGNLPISGQPACLRVRAPCKQAEFGRPGARTSDRPRIAAESASSATSECQNRRSKSPRSAQTAVSLALFSISIADVHIDQFTRIKIYILGLLDLENDWQHADVHALLPLVRQFNLWRYETAALSRIPAES